MVPSRTNKWKNLKKGFVVVICNLLMKSLELKLTEKNQDLVFIIGMCSRMFDDINFCLMCRSVVFHMIRVLHLHCQKCKGCCICCVEGTGKSLLMITSGSS